MRKDTFVTILRKSKKFSYLFLLDSRKQIYLITVICVLLCKYTYLGKVKNLCKRIYIHHSGGEHSRDTHLQQKSTNKTYVKIRININTFTNELDIPQQIIRGYIRIYSLRMFMHFMKILNVKRIYSIYRSLINSLNSFRFKRKKNV